MRDSIKIIFMLFAVVFASTITTMVMQEHALEAATNAARFRTGLYFGGNGGSITNPMPSGNPGLYGATIADAGIVMRACDQNGVCYPMASPLPTAAVGGSADAGSTLGSAAATKLDTCSTGGTGTSCYTLKQVVGILKAIGALAQ